MNQKKKNSKGVTRVGDLDNLVATNSNNNIIGNLFYFTIGQVNMPATMILKMAYDSGLPYSYFSSKYSENNAFKTATTAHFHKSFEGYNIRLFNNQREATVFRREIKQEIIEPTENRMISLGNIWVDKNTRLINYSLNRDAIKGLHGFDILEAIKLTKEYYEVLLESKSNVMIRDIIKNILSSEMDATDIAVHGNLFFIPSIHKEMLTSLELFFDMLEEEHAKRRTTANGGVNYASIPVINSEKLVKEYSREFYNDSQKSLAYIKDKLKKYNKEGLARASSLDNLKDKIAKLSDKKKIYEESLNTTIDDLNMDLKIIEREINTLESKINNSNNLKNQLSMQLD